MKPPGRLRYIIGCVALLLCAFFFVTAAVGRWREQQDLATIRAKIRAREAEIQSAIAKVGDGVPLDAFKDLLPNAHYDEKKEQWVVNIPADYNENSGNTSSFTKLRYFRLDGAVVKPVEGLGGVKSIGCGFKSGGVCYYFWRAWYSSADCPEDNFSPKSPS